MFPRPKRESANGESSSVGKPTTQVRRAALYPCANPWMRHDTVWPLCEARLWRRRFIFFLTP